MLLILLFFTGCTGNGQQAAPGTLKISIEANGQATSLEVTVGTTVQSALEEAGIALENLDRVDPPGYTLLEDGMVIKVTRVREVFTVEEHVIPFERQTVRNESLPEGQTLLVQPGVNGTERITNRQVFENDVEVSNTVFKTEIITEPLAEIVMIGVQKPFTPVPIPGRLVYLASGNAWLMETTTGNRRPLVTTGDLDGRIFSLSPNGEWLLFTRRESQPIDRPDGEEQEARINSLWAINVKNEDARPVNLRVYNIIHYAEWVPNRSMTITYSTVEPRSTAPGWQANNDLQLLTFSASGTIIRQEEFLQANAGGLYGWWGTTFAWSSDGKSLAYSRPDGVGLVDIENGELIPLAHIIPFQTGSDWAWVTGLSWAANNQALYFVNHIPKAGLESQEASPLFDLAAIPLPGEIFEEDDGETGAGPIISMVSQTGMFAYPVSSPRLKEEGGFQVAYLHAIFPEQSESKRYRLAVMDRDGSNRATIFPPADYQGLDPQRVVWSPAAFQNGNYWLAVTYQGNLWLVDSQNGLVQQVTGDGLINRIDWK